VPALVSALTLVKAIGHEKIIVFSVSRTGSSFMPTTKSVAKVERIPTMQRILDNPFLLLFLGVTIPTVLYILWGVMEIASIPVAK
jgi:hypothetical protein